MRGRILIGTSDGIREPRGADRRLAGAAIDHLLVTGAELWAVVDGRGVWRATNGDGELVVAPAASGVNCVLPREGGALVGAGDATLFELAGDELRRLHSFDAAPGRSSWYTPWGGPPDVRSMAAGVDGTLFVNVHVGGVLRSTDGGTSWTDTMDIHADVHQVVADPVRPGHAYAATARGLAVTTTNGDTWEFTTDGLNSPYCRAVAVSKGNVFLSASRGPSGRDAGVFRRSREGGPFQRCTSGLPDWFSTNVDTFCLAGSDDLVVAGDAAGAVYASTDDGATWTVAADDIPDVRCLTLG